MITLQDLTRWLTQYHVPVAITLVCLPIIAFINGQFLIKNFKSPGTGAKIYAVLTYLSVIPGICAFITIAYLFFFTRTNLLRELDIIIHIGPAISMVATLTIIGRYMSFAIIPGFDRLSGLMVITGVSFILILILYRLRILIGFWAGAEVLLVIFLIIFFLLKIGWERFAGKKRK